MDLFKVGTVSVRYSIRQLLKRFAMEALVLWFIGMVEDIMLRGRLCIVISDCIEMKLQGSAMVGTN